MRLRLHLPRRPVHTPCWRGRTSRTPRSADRITWSGCGPSPWCGHRGMCVSLGACCRWGRQRLAHLPCSWSNRTQRVVVVARTQLYLVRHGEQEPVSGHARHGGLSELGREQADRLGQRLRDVPFLRSATPTSTRSPDRYNSDLPRKRLAGSAPVEPELIGDLGLYKQRSSEL